MRVSYKGHVIDVYRENCLGGWEMLYVTVIREEDGYICLEYPEDSAETVPDKIQQMKNRIDAELGDEDPWNENGTYDHVLY